MRNTIDYIDKYLGYETTPTRRVKYGNRQFFVKDERARLGLNSFKALGAFYATCKLALSVSDKSTAKVITATAGNHGIGVAFACKVLHLPCEVYVPKTTAAKKIQKIQSLEASVQIIQGSYEDACRFVDDYCAEPQTIKVLDYDAKSSPDSVAYVREGYKLIAFELSVYFSSIRTWPKRVYIQGGVGTFASALTDYIRHYWQVQPQIIVVEPESADCLQLSHINNQPVRVNNDIESAMQSIDCKQASASAVSILAEYSVSYTTINDHAAKRACHELLKFNLNTTPTGAAGFAAALNDVSSEGDTSLVIITENEELEL